MSYISVTIEKNAKDVNAIIIVTILEMVMLL